MATETQNETGRYTELSKSLITGFIPPHVASVCKGIRKLARRMTYAEERRELREQLGKNQANVKELTRAVTLLIRQQAE